MAANTEVKILPNGKIEVNGVVVDCAAGVEDVVDEEVVEEEIVELEESSRESYSKAGKSGA